MVPAGIRVANRAGGAFASTPMVYSPEDPPPEQRVIVVRDHGTFDARAPRGRRGPNAGDY